MSYIVSGKLPSAADLFNVKGKKVDTRCRRSID